MPYLFYIGLPRTFWQDVFALQTNWYFVNLYATNFIGDGWWIQLMGFHKKIIREIYKGIHCERSIAAILIVENNTRLFWYQIATTCVWIYRVKIMEVVSERRTSVAFGAHAHRAIKAIFVNVSDIRIYIILLYEHSMKRKSIQNLCDKIMI